MKNHDGWVSGKELWEERGASEEAHDSLNCYCVIVCNDCGQKVKVYYHKGVSIPKDCPDEKDK